ncbi:MAG: type IV toxin-antitoxin system AbiEi family antitoxin domain-containing protein [Actinomycetota bacterium]
MASYLENDKRAENLARQQFGLITVEQAFAAGMSRHAVQSRTENGRWIRILPGVLKMRAAPTSWDQSLLAPFLWTTRLNGVVSAVSHRAAARLFGLGPFRQTPSLELCLSKPRRCHVQKLVTHVDGNLDPTALVKLGPYLTTKAPRTLVDLASIVDEETLENCLEDALRMKRCSLASIHEAVDLSQGRGKKGVATLRRLLELRGGEEPAESPLEVRVIRLIRSAGLARPQRQFSITTTTKRDRRIDLAYPEVGLAIECEGYEHHSGRLAWSKDLSRRNELIELGWQPIHVTTYDLDKDPQRFLRLVQGYLGSRNPPSGTTF